MAHQPWATTKNWLSCEQWSPFSLLQTMLSIKNKAVQKTRAMLIPKSQQKYEFPWASHTNDDHRKQSEPERPVIVQFQVSARRKQVSLSLFKETSLAVG